MIGSTSAQQREFQRWPGLQPRPTIVRTSIESEWKGAFFQETLFSSHGSFDFVNPALAISYLPHLSSRFLGQKHFRKPTREFGLSMPGDGYCGEWEGQSIGLFLFIERGAVETFTGTDPNRLALGPLVRANGSGRVIEGDQIAHLIRLLHFDVKALSPDGPMLGEQLILRILTRLFPMDQERQRKMESDVLAPRFSIARDMIHEKFNERLKLENIASACGITVRHLCRMFRSQTGMTPHEYIVKCRVSHAIELIKKGDMELAEIADAVGFFDQAHMSATFRRVTGFAPSRFRNT